MEYELYSGNSYNHAMDNLSCYEYPTAVQRSL
jgi:hypothetical protein